MKTLKKLSLLLLLLDLSGCKNTDGEIKAISPLRPTVLNVSFESSSTWPGLCHRVEVSLTTESNVPTTAGRVRTVDLTSNLGTLYSDSACTTPTTEVTLSASTQNFFVYFRSPTTGSADINVSGSQLTQGSATLTIATPTAQIALGQQAMNFNSANFPTLSAQSLYNPYNVTVAAGKLFVADYTNHRVLIWNTIPTSTQQAADVVLGQANMTTNTCNTGGLSAQTLCGPSFVHSDGTRVVVSDEGNSRVLIWNTIPTTNGAAANVVLGQANMTANVDYSGSPAANTLYYPGGVFISGTKLFVVDSGDNRILIWNTIPTSNQQAADLVVGQANLTSNVDYSASPAATNMFYPYTVTIQNNKMFAADYGNSRVLIWNTIPTANNAAADVVVGQPNFATTGPNSGGVGAATLSEAASPVVDEQGRMYIGDYSNNRILIWNQVPTVNGQAADAVMGQANFTTVTANTGGVSATSIYNPWGLFINDGKLWAAEFGNHRVLQYTIPY